MQGQKFSRQFRTDVAGVADEIESFPSVVLKKEKISLGPRFDAIDKKLTLSGRADGCRYGGSLCAVLRE